MATDESSALVSTATGAYDLTARISRIGSDILVAIWGGDQPHIGAVAIAEARPSLRDPAATSSSASVHCVVGHKEDEIVKSISLAMAARLKTRVVVTAGIHWDHLTEGGIEAVSRNADVLLEQILARVAEGM